MERGNNSSRISMTLEHLFALNEEVTRDCIQNEAAGGIKRKLAPSGKGEPTISG